MQISLPPHPSRSSNPGAPGREVVYSTGYPLTLHWLALAAALGLLLLAAVQHIVPLLAMTSFLLVLAAASWFWSRQSLKRISCQLTLGQERAFFGEQIDLAFAATNAKRLFLPWLEIEAELPRRLASGSLKADSPYSKERLRWTTSISGGQQVRWKHRLECKARGDYQLGPVRLRSGDVFGLFPREMIPHLFEPLLVYPRIVPVDKLELPLSELTGETGIPRSIYEDATQTMGTREYQHNDPFKRIHWKASARRSQIQARQYESTTSLSLFLILDTGSFCGDNADEEAFELAVTAAASLSYEACRQESPFGLMANSYPEIQLPVSSGRSQLFLILEALARVQPASKAPLGELMDRCRGNLPVGTTLVIISHGLSDTLARLLHRLRQDGYSMLLVSAGRPVPDTGLADIPAVSVLSLADLSRDPAEAAR
ncbi:MAG: DUF58 domain-containing protein [Chloroflexota bacterium]